jgi:hypothetical protein
MMEFLHTTSETNPIYHNISGYFFVSLIVYLFTSQLSVAIL